MQATVDHSFHIPKFSGCMGSLAGSRSGEAYKVTTGTILYYSREGSSHGSTHGFLLSASPSPVCPCRCRSQLLGFCSRHGGTAAHFGWCDVHAGNHPRPCRTRKGNPQAKPFSEGLLQKRQPEAATVGRQVLRTFTSWQALRRPRWKSE